MNCGGASDMTSRTWDFLFCLLVVAVVIVVVLPVGAGDADGPGLYRYMLCPSL